MSTQKSKFGRRYDEEFKRGVAALAAQPGKSDGQVARGPRRERLERLALAAALRGRQAVGAIAPLG